MVRTHSVGGEINEATGSYSDSPYVFFATVRNWAGHIISTIGRPEKKTPIL